MSTPNAAAAATHDLSARSPRAASTWLASALALVLMLGAWMVAPTPALAGSADKIKVEFVGFGSNPDFYAVVVKSKLAGDTFAIYQVTAPEAPVFTTSLEGTSTSKVLKSSAVTPYQIQTSGHVESATAPQGWSLVGKKLGLQLQVALTDGTAESAIGYIPLTTDSTGLEAAEAKVSKVFWSGDGSRVVLIYHEKLGGEFPIDSERHAAYVLQLPAAGGGDEAPAKKK